MGASLDSARIAAGAYCLLGDGCSLAGGLLAVLKTWSEDLRKESEGHDSMKTLIATIYHRMVA